MRHDSPFIRAGLALPPNGVADKWIFRCAMLALCMFVVGIEMGWW